MAEASPFAGMVPKEMPSIGPTKEIQLMAKNVKNGSRATALGLVNNMNENFDKLWGDKTKVAQLLKAMIDDDGNYYARKLFEAHRAGIMFVGEHAPDLVQLIKTTPTWVAEIIYVTDEATGDFTGEVVIVEK